MPAAGQQEERHHADGADDQHAEEGALAELRIEDAGKLEDQRLRGAGTQRVIEALADGRAFRR